MTKTVKHIARQVKSAFTSNLAKGIFFLHVPKCGGTSIHHAISRHYHPVGTDGAVINLNAPASTKAAELLIDGDTESTRLNDYPILKLRETLLLYYMNHKKAVYISGHFGFSEVAYQHFSSKFDYITVLRNPVNRYISLYFYNRYKKSDHYKLQDDLLTFIETQYGQSQGHEFVKFIGGPRKDNDYTSGEAISKACENLARFQIVGLLEEMDHFIQNFEQRFNVQLKIKRKNISPVTKAFKEQIINKSILKKIERICEPDMNVFEHAKKRILDQTVKSAVS